MIERNGMPAVFGYANVFWDTASDYSLAQVNERVYLTQFFFALKEKMGGEFQKFAFYLLFSHNPLVAPHSAIIDSANKVLFWFSDESGAEPQHLFKNYQFIFKSYLQLEKGNCFANTLGFVNEGNDLTNTETPKSINIFFAGNLNVNREQLYHQLFLKKFPGYSWTSWLPRFVIRKLIMYWRRRHLNLSEDNSVFLFSNGFKSGLDYQQYRDYLSRSRYVLCPRGFESAETFRHFEALAAGCLVISEPLPQNSLYPEPPFLFYNTLNDLLAIFRKIESSEVDEDDLRERHKAFYESHASVGANAKRVGNICLRLQPY